MKKFFCLIALLLPLLAVSQVYQITANRIFAGDSLRVSDWWIKKITRDLNTADSNSNSMMPTNRAVMDMIRSRGGGGGGGNSGNLIVSNTTPSGQGNNGDYFFNQSKGHLYQKSGGSWGVPIGYLYADTVTPITPRDTLLMPGPMIKLPDAWDSRCYIYNNGSFLKNPNAIGNGLLGFKDDAVRFEGWNVTPAGTRINTNEAANYHQWESHFDTRQIGDSAFEHHKVHLFVPGSVAHTWFPTGIRVFSENTSKSMLFSQIYYTGNEFKWKWKKSASGQTYDWMTAYPGGLELTMPVKIDSIDANGGAFVVLNNKTLWQTDITAGVSRALLTNNTGHKDTSFLINDAGSFIFKNLASTGYTIFDNAGGIAMNNGATGIWGVNSAGDMTLLNQAGYNSALYASFHNNAFGLTLNKTPDRNSYLDIASDPVAAASHNNYLRLNITDPDSVSVPLRLIFEKLRGGSFTTNTLQNTPGYEISLNDVSTFGTQHTANTAPDGKYTADFIWSSKRAGPMLERMRLTDTGYLSIKSLDTDGSAPTTSGTKKMVVTDANGQLSFDNIPGGTSYTFSNGLTESGGAVKLGGTQTENTTINSGGFTTEWTGSNDGEIMFSVSNTGTTNASAISGTATGTTSVGVTGTSSQYIGVFGSSTSNTGIQGQSSSGVGVIGVSSTGAGVRAQINPSSANAIENAHTILRTSSAGAGANGLGAAIQFELETATNGTSQMAGSIAFAWEDATNATRTSRYEVYTVNAGTSARKFSIKGNGQIVADGYGAGALTGTATTIAAFDGSGNVIETTAGNLLELSGSNVQFNDAYMVSIPNNQISLKSRMKRLSYTVPDANFSTLDTRQEGLFELPDITGNRTFNMFTGSSVDGHEFYIYNGNTSGTFSWSFTGNHPKKGSDGSTVTTMTNGVLYHIIGVYVNSTATWLIVNQ